MHLRFIASIYLVLPILILTHIKHHNIVFFKSTSMHKIVKILKIYILRKILLHTLSIYCLYILSYYHLYIAYILPCILFHILPICRLYTTLYVALSIYYSYTISYVYMEGPHYICSPTKKIQARKTTDTT
jgi:hypothetical protein